MAQPFVFGQPPTHYISHESPKYYLNPQFYFRAPPPPVPQFVLQNNYFSQYNTCTQRRWSQAGPSSSTFRPVQASPAASDASSATSSSPPPVHVVCTAPIVAPVPLPYHSPTFLQFDLPDDDEDLSHPPYVSRPHKRKRTDDDEEDDEDASRSVFQLTLAPPHAKRRAVLSERRGRWNTAATAAQAHPVLPQPPIPPQLPSMHPGHAICR